MRFNLCVQNTCTMSLTWGYKITLYIDRVISVSSYFCQISFCHLKKFHHHRSRSFAEKVIHYSPILNSCRAKISLFQVFNIYHPSHFGDSIKRCMKTGIKFKQENNFVIILFFTLHIFNMDRIFYLNHYVNI